MLNRIEALRTAMFRRCDHLRDIYEALNSAAAQLPRADANIRISADEADSRELLAYRTFFDSFLPEPIKVDVSN